MQQKRAEMQGNYFYLFIYLFIAVTWNSLLQVS